MTSDIKVIGLRVAGTAVAFALGAGILTTRLGAYTTAGHSWGLRLSGTTSTLRTNT